MVDIWGSVNRGMQFGDTLREREQEAEYGQAFQQGGVDAVEQAAGRRGDMAGVEGARMMARKERQFEDDQTNAAFERLQNFGRVATPVLRRARQLPPEQRAGFLNAPHIRQRFEAFGFQPEQIDNAIANMSNPETAEATFQNLFAAFGGQGLDWSVLNTQTGEIGAIDPVTGHPVMSGGRAPVNPGEWQTGSATHAYRVRPDGSVETGGALPVRETRPYGVGTIPAGYRLTADGTLEPIQGGPAAARVETAESRRMNQLLSSMTTNQNVMNSIADAERLSSNDGLGGGTGLNALLSGVPGTTANNLQAAVDTIVANIGFDRLQEMRMNSPTGGALGAVTERELALLQAVVASLRTSQSNDQFRRNLTRVRDQYVRSMQAIRAAYEQDFGALGEGPVPAPGGPAPQQMYDAPPGPTSAPQPGQIEDGFRFKGGDPGDPNNWEPVR